MCSIDFFRKAFPFYLLHDPLLVVVAQRPAQLVVVHGGSVLLDPPPAGHL